MTTEQRIDPEAARLLYDYGRDRLAQQMQTIRALDAKVNQVFVAAGVAIGLAGFSRGISPANIWVDVLLTLAVLAYIATGAIVGRHAWTRTYHGGGTPAKVWEGYSHDDPTEIRILLIANSNAAFALNAAIAAQKAQLLRWALCTAALEFAFIGFAILAVRWA